MEHWAVCLFQTNTLSKIYHFNLDYKQNSEKKIYKEKILPTYLFNVHKQFQ